MATKSRPTLYSIGYEGLDIAQLLSALQANRIETVIDIRELPLSHKKGFSKAALQGHLGRKEVRYVHVRALGCPRAIRIRYPGRYRSVDDWKHFEQAYRKYLAGQGAALTALSAMAVESRSALLCVEADPRRCHRSVVAQAAAHVMPLRVHHIVSANPNGDARGAKTKKSRKK